MGLNPSAVSAPKLDLLFSQPEGGGVFTWTSKCAVFGAGTPMRPPVNMKSPSTTTATSRTPTRKASAVLPPPPALSAMEISRMRVGIRTVLVVRGSVLASLPAELSETENAQLEGRRRHH